MLNVTIPKNLVGELVAVPKKEYNLFNSFLSFVDKDQLFFWTKEWQKKEKEVDKESRNGKSADNPKDLKKILALMKR